MTDPQRSFEWYKSRLGKITMSMRSKTLMEGGTHALNNLLKTLHWEQGMTEDQAHEEYEREMRIGDVVPNLEWGRRHEEEMIEFYEMTRNVEVIRPGFVVHSMWPNLVGDSADFIETIDGTLEGTPKWVGEIKCPSESDNHLKTIRYGMPGYHHNQTQGHMECHGMTVGRFGSYDPRHPVEANKLYVQNLEVDLAWQKRFRERMEQFNEHFQKDTLFEADNLGKATDGIPSMF